MQNNNTHLYLLINPSPFFQKHSKIIYKIYFPTILEQHIQHMEQTSPIKNPTSQQAYKNEQNENKTENCKNSRLEYFLV